jgi:hypothetical protein
MITITLHLHRLVREGWKRRREGRREEGGKEAPTAIKESAGVIVPALSYLILFLSFASFFFFHFLFLLHFLLLFL